MKSNTQSSAKSDAVLDSADSSTPVKSLVHNAWILSGSAVGGLRCSHARASLPFSMKGGYVGSGATRRLMIVGKIGKF
jgi:hypothetical protein